MTMRQTLGVIFGAAIGLAMLVSRRAAKRGDVAQTIHYSTWAIVLTITFLASLD